MTQGCEHFRIGDVLPNVDKKRRETSRCAVNASQMGSSRDLACSKRATYCARQRVALSTQPLLEPWLKLKGVTRLCAITTGQTTHGLNRASAKERGCQTARLPNGAAADERGCRGAQLPKSAAAQRCGGPRKSTDATMNRSDCGNDRPAREHQASVCVKTQSVDVRRLMYCERRQSHRMDSRSYSPRDGHDSVCRRRGTAQRQPDHSLRRSTRHEREYSRSTRRSGRPLRAGDVTMNRSCRTLNPSARRDRGERTAQ
jgi:hypothetical protein